MMYSLSLLAAVIVGVALLEWRGRRRPREIAGLVLLLAGALLLFQVSLPGWIQLNEDRPGIGPDAGSMARLAAETLGALILMGVGVAGLRTAWWRNRQ